MVAASPLFKGLPVHLLMSGKANPDAPKHFEWAKQTLESAGFDVPGALIPGDAESVIARYVKEHEIDILIIGSYSHSTLRSLLLGSKTSDLLRSSRIPTLLLR
jgi:nucleotide-binding universal stress UspA family protein